MVERKVKVRFDVDTSDLSAGLAKAKSLFNKFALSAAGAAGTATGAMIALTFKSMGAVDAQAKLAFSLSTTTVSMQNLARAGDLAGVGLEQIAQVGKDLTRRLSQAAIGMGDARDTLKSLNLSAEDLLALPLDQRIATITEALNKFVPESKRAAVAGKLFGEEASIAALRLKPEVIAQATAQVKAFGVAVSDVDAAAIESANDALSQIGLTVTGVGNQLAVALAPSLQLAADKFALLAQKGGPIADSIATLTTSVERLAATMTSESFANAAVSLFTGIMDLANGTANAFIWVTENTETLTYTLSGLAIAVAALGGPITWVIALTAAAVAGFASMNKEGRNSSPVIYSVRDAEAALNGELAIFAQSTNPAAREESRKRVISLKEQALAALNAAKAEMALAEAQAESAAQASDLKGQDLLDAAAGPGEGMSNYLDGVLPDERAQAAAERVKAITLQVQELTSALKDMDASGGGSATGGGPVATPSVPGSFDLPSSGAGGKGSEGDTLTTRLEALQAELATEQEVVDQWYAAAQKTLEEALAQNKITRAQYDEDVERLEKEHQDRMLGLSKTGLEGQTQVMIGALGDSLSALGSFNGKAFKIAKVAGAAQALISTLTGEAKALELPFPLNLAAAAKVFSSGMGIVSAIKSFSGSGSPSSSRASTSAGIADSSPAVAEPTRTANVSVVGDVIGKQTMQELVSTLNSAMKAGYRLNLEWN